MKELKYQQLLEDLVKEQTLELITAKELLKKEIYERKKFLKELRESEVRYRQLVEMSPDAIVIHDEEKLLFVNSVSVQLFGAANIKELIGRWLRDIIHYDYIELFRERVRLLREKCQAAPVAEFKLIRFDGIIIDVEVATVPYRYRGELAAQTVIRDISERKKVKLGKLEARERNERATRLASLGVVSASRAHEINQPLNIGFFSEAMREIAAQAAKYHLDPSMPVLIQGETGTGKEVVAKLIHYGNMTKTSVFVDLNCAALTPSLFESELFGYEAGTFTGGAVGGKKGKLDLAKGGTLFLDEVGEVPLELQGKLLRVIQEKEFYRVGGLKKIKADVRLICATNADLEEKVKLGFFRKDLYYRLKVGYLVIPPLHQRKEDILPLASIFLQEFSQLKGKDFCRISDTAGKILSDYHWPGNVRELRNTMEWVTFMYNDVEVKPEHLGIINKERNYPIIPGTKQVQLLNYRQFSLPDEGLPLSDYIEAIVEKALAMHWNNKAETARYLGISRSTLYSHIKRINNKKD